MTYNRLIQLLKYLSKKKTNLTLESEIMKNYKQTNIFDYIEINRLKTLVKTLANDVNLYETTTKKYLINVLRLCIHNSMQVEKHCMYSLLKCHIQYNKNF